MVVAAINCDMIGEDLHLIGGSTTIVRGQQREGLRDRRIKAKRRDVLSVVGS